MKYVRSPFLFFSFLFFSSRSLCSFVINILYQIRGSTLIEPPVAQFQRMATDPSVILSFNDTVQRSLARRLRSTFSTDIFWREMNQMFLQKRLDEKVFLNSYPSTSPPD